jgi:hypothetical protein
MLPSSHPTPPCPIVLARAPRGCNLQSYRPGYYFYEVIEKVRLVLVSCIGLLFMPDTSSQIVLVVIINLASAVAGLKFRPFSNEDDSGTYTLMQWYVMTRATPCRVLLLVLLPLVSWWQVDLWSHGWQVTMQGFVLSRVLCVTFPVQTLVFLRFFMWWYVVVCAPCGICPPATPGLSLCSPFLASCSGRACQPPTTTGRSLYPRC